MRPIEPSRRAKKRNDRNQISESKIGIVFQDKLRNMTIAMIVAMAEQQIASGQANAYHEKEIE